MKFSFFIFLLPLIIASSSFNYEAFFKEIENLKDSEMIITVLDQAIEELVNIFDDQKRKEIGQKLLQVIIYFLKNFKQFKEFGIKLKELKEKLSKFGVSENTLLNGFFSFLGNMINPKMENVCKNIFYTQNYYILSNQNTNIFNQFSKMGQNTNFVNEFSKTVQNANLYKDYLSNEMSQISKFTNKLRFLKAFKYGGNLISGSFKAYEKIKKCKNKDSKAYLVSTAQAATNVGTNFAFGSIGSFLGSFIPIPIAGTFIGGIVGNYVGDYVNSFYDFEC